MAVNASIRALRRIHQRRRMALLRGRCRPLPANLRGRMRPGPVIENPPGDSPSPPVRNALRMAAASSASRGRVDLRFCGKTVVCIASGPSLTAADVELVRRSGHPAIAVNLSIRIAAFARIWYFGDDQFADKYANKIPTDAEKWTCAAVAAQRYAINLHKIRGPYNSGLRAVQLAVELGAGKIILLGYDCQHADDGRRHWHSDYCGLGNAISVRKWPNQFTHLARKVGSSVEILNATRETALTCFQRVVLEDALGIQCVEAVA